MTMIKWLRKIAGTTLRNAGWERRGAGGPSFLGNALGHKIFPAELGVIYQQFDNRQMSDFRYGDIAYANQIREGETVVDVGANVGFYTLLFARQVGEKGKVFSFEPGPISFALLSKNVLMNGYNNVTLVNSAVSNKTGKTKFFLCRTGESDNRLQDVSTPSDIRDAIDVDVVSLDDYFDDTRIDFIKIDIQGSEYLALQGMNRIIASNRDIRILMEFSPHCLEGAGVNLLDFLSYIRSFGFRIHILYDDKPIEETSDKALLSLVGVGKKFSYVDLVLQR